MVEPGFEPRLPGSGISFNDCSVLCCLSMWYVGEERRWVVRGFEKNKAPLLPGWPGSQQIVLSGKEMGGVAAKERYDVSVVTCPLQKVRFKFLWLVLVKESAKTLNLNLGPATWCMAVRGFGVSFTVHLKNGSVDHRVLYG